MPQTLSLQVSEPLDGTRIDRALAVLMPAMSRNFFEKLISSGLVTVDGRPASRPSQKVSAGQTLTCQVPDPAASTIAPENLPLQILYEDSNLVVIDKPPHLVVHPAAGHRDGTLVNALLFHVRDLSGIGGELRPGIVHRLDKDTSGVMIIAKNDSAHRKLTAAWSSDQVRKEYLAVVYGHPSHSAGKIEAPIGRDPRNRKRMAVVTEGRPATTQYETVQSLKYVSLLRCLLHTGRTHQIRVHLKHLGHPIIGDPLYSGPQWRGIPNKRVQKLLSEFPRQALHAHRITVPNPSTGAPLTFESPLPADLRDLVSGLRGLEQTS